MKKLSIIYILFLLTCKTLTPKLEPPKDYKEVLQEIQESNELKQNPKLQNKIINTIKEQSDYSNACYNKILEIEEKLKQLEIENERLKKENENLREQLITWHKIQFGFWVILIIIVISFAIKLLSPFVKTFLKI